MDPLARDQDQRGKGLEGSLRLQVVPMIQGVLGGSHQKGMQGRNQGQLEGGNHLDHLVRTCHCLPLADYLGKAHLDKAQVELQGQKEMVRLGKKQGLRVAVLELLQMGTAQGTAQELLGWRGTALEPLVQVDIVQGSQGQQETHQVLKEVLDIALVLQDRRGTGTALVPLGQMIPQQNHPERRAGWELQGLNQAIRGSQQVEGCLQGPSGWSFLFF